MTLFFAACENYGLVINTQKKLVMHQPPPDTVSPPNAPPPQISVNGTQLQVVDNFQDLGISLSRSTRIDGKVVRRISKPVSPSVAFKHSLESSWSQALHEAEYPLQHLHYADTNARKSHLRSPRHASTRTSTTCPQYQRTLRERIGLVGHLRIICATRTTPIVLPLSAFCSSSSSQTNVDRSSEPPLPSSSSSQSSSSCFFTLSSTSIYCSSSSSSSPAAPAPAVLSPATLVNTTQNPDTSSNINITTAGISGEDRDYTCPHCFRTFIAHIGLIGHLRIHRTETDEPVPGAPTNTHRTRLHFLHFPRTFKHRMGLFGHMRIHESGIDCNPEIPTTSNTQNMPSPTPTPSYWRPVNITVTISATETDLSYPFSPRTFASHIGLVGQLQINHSKTNKPLPEVTNCTRLNRSHSPHCLCTFMHRMGLFGHMRIRENPR
nr:unnamed protein product [Spirometra erinaceieuropaei]